MKWCGRQWSFQIWRTGVTRRQLTETSRLDASYAALLRPATQERRVANVVWRRMGCPSPGSALAGRGVMQAREGRHSICRFVPLSWATRLLGIETPDFDEGFLLAARADAGGLRRARCQCLRFGRALRRADRRWSCRVLRRPHRAAGDRWPIELQQQ